VRSSTRDRHSAAEAGFRALRGEEGNLLDRYPRVGEDQKAPLNAFGLRETITCK
jgi:hypothetical protein